MKQIDVNEVYILFKELKKQLKQVNENSAPVAQPEIEMPDLSVVSDLTAKLDEVIDEVRKPVKTEHHHIFSIASNKIFFSVIGISVARVQFKLSRQISIFVCTLKTECYEQGRIFIGSVTVLRRV
jgi:SepF-like predicted cell division protein (DUF552 family)